MFLQMTYKVQEALCVGTRHKVFHFLTQGIQWPREPSGHTAISFPKMYIPEWQWTLGASHHNNFFGCLKYKHILRLPSLAVISPNLVGDKPSASCVELCTGHLQIRYKLV